VGSAEEEPFRLGEWLVLPSRNRLESRDGVRTIEPRVMSLLVCLASRPGTVVSRDDLLATVWADVVTGDEAVTRAVSELRKALGDDARSPRYVETISKRGYRLLSRPRAATGDVGTGGARLRESRARGRDRAHFGLLAAGLVAALLTFALTALQRSRRVESWSPSSVRPLTALQGKEIDPAWSPGGREIAFSWNGGSGSNFDLYTMPADGGTPTRLTRDPSTEVEPAWSPDGHRLAFARGAGVRTRILLIDASGGAEREVLLTGASWTYGLDWSPDGRFLAFTDRTDPDDPDHVALLDLESLAVRAVTSPPASAQGDRHPRFSPDGTQLAFVRSEPDGRADLYRVSVRGGRESRVTRDQRPVSGLTWGADGSRLIFSSQRSGASRIWRVAVAGGPPQILAAETGDVADLSYSRATGALAYERYRRDRNIWRLGLRRPESAPRRWIASTRDETSPAFSPAGDRVVFASNRSGPWELWLCGAEGGEATRLTSLAATWLRAPRFSPDARHVVFVARVGAEVDVYLLGMLDGRLTRLTRGPASEAAPFFSVDGRWIYFASDRSGSWQIWRLRTVSPGSPERVTRSGGLTAFPAPDGRSLFVAKPGIDGLWQVSLDGGAESRVLESGWSGEWGTWAPFAGGVYFVDRGDEPRATLYRWDMTGEGARAVATLDNVSRFGLAASPDGDQVLFAQVDSTEIDLEVAQLPPDGAPRKRPRAAD
jgi:Tol biopolymer transport system component/DNA-binding winged helix-turn-helix (wHTH) protein